MKRLTLLLAVLISIPRCGEDFGDATLIIVTVPMRTAAVQSLRLWVSLDGHMTTMSEQITSDLDEFGLLLGQGATGSFVLTAEGVDQTGCVISRWETDTVLTGHDRVRLTLHMNDVSPPRCPATL